jgi:hypothetical protein
MRHSLHRSRAFWSGLVVLLGIGGLWVDSMYRERAIVAHRGVFVESGGFVQGEGLLLAFYQHSPGVSPVLPWQMVVHASPDNSPEGWFPPPAFKKIQHPTTEHWQLEVPHWLLGLGVLVAWAGFLLQRRRTSRRLAKDMPAETIAG